jgi:hypothetical protein
LPFSRHEFSYHLSSLSKHVSDLVPEQRIVFALKSLGDCEDGGVRTEVAEAEEGTVADKEVLAGVEEGGLNI